MSMALDAEVLFDQCKKKKWKNGKMCAGHKHGRGTSLRFACTHLNGIAQARRVFFADSRLSGQDINIVANNRSRATGVLAVLIVNVIYTRTDPFDVSSPAVSLEKVVSKEEKLLPERDARGREGLELRADEQTNITRLGALHHVVVVMTIITSGGDLPSTANHGSRPRDDRGNNSTRCPPRASPRPEWPLQYRQSNSLFR